MLLAVVDRRLQHLALGREPEAVVDELGIARHQLVLQMHGAAVERDGSRCRGAPPAESCRPASRRRRATSCRRSGSPPGPDGRRRCRGRAAFSLVSSGGRRQGLAVDSDGIAALEVDGEDGRLVRRRPPARWCAGRRTPAPRPAGSSSTLPSDEECNRLASTEKGASPRLSLAIGIWCCSANSISASRLLNSHSRHGRDHVRCPAPARSSRARSGPGRCPCRWRRG